MGSRRNSRHRTALQRCRQPAKQASVTEAIYDAGFASNSPFLRERTPCTRHGTLDVSARWDRHKHSLRGHTCLHRLVLIAQQRKHLRDRIRRRPGVLRSDCVAASPRLSWSQRPGFRKRGSRRSSLFWNRPAKASTCRWIQGDGVPATVWQALPRSRQGRRRATSRSPARLGVPHRARAVRAPARPIRSRRRSPVIASWPGRRCRRLPLGYRTQTRASRTAK